MGEINENEPSLGPVEMVPPHLAAIYRIPPEHAVWSPPPGGHVQGYQVAAAYDEHIQRVQHLNQGLAVARQDVEARRPRVLEERQEALLALARAYLPELSAPALQRAEQLSGYRGFSRRDPLSAMAHEAQVLGKTVLRIEADESYQRREYLVGPHGEYTRELAERQSMLDEWQRECDRFETLDGFDRLLEHKYDTPDFDLSWWQSSYWNLWAKGDAVCEALELDDFGDDVLPAYEKVRVPRDGWREQVAQTQAKIDAVHDLVRRHDEAQLRIPRLPELYLDQCNQVLAEFLDPADPGLLHDWAMEDGGDRPILLALRRSAGLKAKLDALDDALAGLEALAQDLATRASKYRRKAAKYRRPKRRNRTQNDSADPKFVGKSDKIAAELQKLQRQLAKLDDFDDYDRLDLDQDPQLLWVSMTQKRPSKYLPSHRGWYTRNPHAKARLLADEDDHAQAVGIAVSALDHSDGGYLS